MNALHLSEIRAGLRAGIDGLARRLLGEPVRGSRHETVHHAAAIAAAYAAAPAPPAR